MPGSGGPVQQGATPSDPLAAAVRKVQAAGLLLSAPHSRQSCVQATDCGVTLAWLRGLVKQLAGPGGLMDADLDTTTFVQRFIAPVTKARKCRLFDLIPPEHTGKPQWCVVHAWGASFMHMVSQLHHSLTLVDDEDSPPIDESTVFVWLDVLAISQHPQLNVHADVTLVKELVKTCQSGAAVVMDRKLVALSRLWCAYEMWAFVNYNGIGAIKICLPEPATVQFVQQYEAKLRQSDMLRLEASKSEDKSRLLSEIKSSVGVKIMFKTYQESLLLNVRSYLRWKKDLSYLGLYCALLLKEGELSHLQLVLHGIPELQDDEKMLREIEDIFATYVTSSGDELDLMSFTQVLAAAGFDEVEARTIFHEVNTDGGSGVGIDEFKSWWMAAQRQDSSRHKAPLHLTAEALTENLSRMQQLLLREKHDDVAAVFSDFLDEVQEGRALKPGSPLPTSSLKGDWQTSCDQVSWKLHSHDYKGAATLIFEVLMWNADMIQMPPSQIPKPDRQQSYTDFFRCLATELELFAGLLKWQPGRKQHAEYYARFSQELRSPMVASLLADAQKSAGGSHAKLDFEKFSVVREMITLKYGDNQPIHHSLIVEAEKSLASWMAGNRMSSDVTRAKVKSNLNSLYSDYLSKNNTSSRAADGSVLTIPNGKKGPNFRRASALVTDGESVLARLGPDAVAFLASQQEAQERAAAAATATAGDKQQQGAGEASGSAAAAAAGGSEAADAAPGGAEGAASTAGGDVPAAKVVSVGTPAAGSGPSSPTKSTAGPRTSDAGRGDKAAPASPSVRAPPGGKVRRSSMLSALEPGGREAQPDITTMMSGGGAFGQVQGTLRRVAGVAAADGGAAVVAAALRRSAEIERGPEPSPRQTFSYNTLDVLDRIYAKAAAAQGDDGASGTSATPHAPTHAGPSMGGGRGGGRRRASSFMPDGAGSTAGDRMDIAQLAATTTPGLAGVGIRMPGGRARRSSAVDYSFLLGGGPGSGSRGHATDDAPPATPAPAPAPAPVHAASAVERSAGSRSEPLKRLEQLQLPPKLDLAPGPSSTLPKISMTTSGSGNMLYAADLRSPGTPTRPKSLSTIIVSPSGGSFSGGGGGGGFGLDAAGNPGVEAEDMGRFHTGRGGRAGSLGSGLGVTLPRITAVKGS